MKYAGRLGDDAYVGTDDHACPACPHAAIGPATSGSLNVLINNRPALRVGDRGIHAACCGEGTWSADSGAPAVLINGRSMHRQGDLTTHCGGGGTLVEGSSNVIIGDYFSSAHADSPTHDQGFVLTYDGTDLPAANVKYRLVSSGGRVIEGRTDDFGRTTRVASFGEEIVSLQLIV